MKVFVDYTCKMENLLEEMKSLFAKLGPKAISLSTLLGRIFNLSVNTCHWICGA